MKINSNHINIAFDREINSSKAWFEKRVFDFSGYKSRDLIDRLMQHFVGVFLTPYVTMVSSIYKKNKNCFPPVGTKIKAVDASLEIGTGIVTVTPKQFLAHALNFLFHWSYCFFSMLLIKGEDNNKTPAVLVFGVGEGSLFVDGCDERFVEYCRSGPVEPLRSGKSIYVEASSGFVSSNRHNFKYCKRPLIDLLRSSPIGGVGRIKLLVKHLRLFFEYLLAIIRLPQLSLLGKDFAYSKISSELDRHGLIESIVLTCSNYTNQPMWLRGLIRAKVHMVWHAQDWQETCYTTDKLSSNRPNLRWIWADIHWVWTHAFAEYLSSIGLGASFKAVGPIMWYMPKLNTPDSKVLQVVIFDTFPFSDEIASKIGKFTNYYHPDYLVSFIKDILSLKKELEKKFSLPIKFCIKQKRGYIEEYDLKYFNYIKKLDLDEVVSLMPHYYNIYSLISESHLAICYPFGSPAEIANTLSVPSIYYDPTGSVFCEEIGAPGSLMQFISNPNDLLRSVMLILSRVVSNR